MAVRKRTKKPVQTNIAPSKQAMLWYVVLIIGVVVFALAYLWQHLPKRPTYQAPQAPIVQEPNQKQRLTCERAGGKWTDCGNPCHGQDAESCIAMCEPQCLCGGGPNYSCPANTVCTNKVSAKPGEVAIGVCRESAAVDAVKPVPTKIIATVDASVYPFTVSSTVLGNASSVLWIVSQEGNIIDKGIWTFPSATTTVLEKRIFLSEMPGTEKLSFQFTTQWYKKNTEYYPSDVSMTTIESTTTKLSPMTRKRYFHEKGIGCGGPLSSVSEVIPKSVYPYESTLRAMYSNDIDLSVSNGIATVKVSDITCEDEDIIKAITKDFPTIKSLVIQEQSAQTQP